MPRCPHCGGRVLEIMPSPGDDILGCEHCGRVFEERDEAPADQPQEER